MRLFCFFFLFAESCGETVCDANDENAIALKGVKGQSTSREEEAILHAGTSVFVLKPGDMPSKLNTFVYYLYIL